MSVYISAELRRRVRKHFSDACAYCQTSEALTVTIFEIEHIIPRAADGETVFENLCLACPSCNRYKADRLKGQNDVRLFHPHNDVWSGHFDWSVDGTYVVGLTDIGEATITALRMNRPQMIRVRRMWVAFNAHPPKIP